jgi:hypothetical protein
MEGCRSSVSVVIAALNEEIGIGSTKLERLAHEKYWMTTQ